MYQRPFMVHGESPQPSWYRPTYTSYQFQARAEYIWDYGVRVAVMGLFIVSSIANVIAGLVLEVPEGFSYGKFALYCFAIGATIGSLFFAGCIMYTAKLVRDEYKLYRAWNSLERLK